VGRKPLQCLHRHLNAAVQIHKYLLRGDSLELLSLRERTCMCLFELLINERGYCLESKQLDRDVRDIVCTWRKVSGNSVNRDFCRALNISGKNLL